MEFLKCRDVRWKGPKKRNIPDVVTTTAKHRDGRSQISRYGWMQLTYMRSVSFWGKFTSGSRISASRSDLLKRDFKQISTAGADTAAGSKFPPKWDTAHVRQLHPSVAWNLTTSVGSSERLGIQISLALLSGEDHSCDVSCDVVYKEVQGLQSQYSAQSR